MKLRNVRVGPKLKSHDSPRSGRYRGLSGPKANIAETTLLTRSRPWVYLNPGNCQSVNNASSNMTITTHSAKLRK